MTPRIWRTPPPDVPYTLMYKWPFEIGGPEAATVIRVPEPQVAWRQAHGWRLLIRDSDAPLELGYNQQWIERPNAPVKKPFYPQKDEADGA